MSLQVTLLFCLTAHLAQSDPYVRYGIFPARGVATVNTGFGIGGLATGLAAQTLGLGLGQTANNRLTVGYRPAGSTIGYTTLGSVLMGNTALRPSYQASGASNAQNNNAQASLQVSTATANSNGMQGSWAQGATQSQGLSWQNAATGGLSGQVGAGVQMGSQNGASASNGANGMNRPSWADVSRPQLPASQNSNWQGGISAGMAGQSGGGSSLGMNQGFSGQGSYAGSMQAGMSNSQAAHQNTGTATANSNGMQGSWAQGATQSQSPSWQNAATGGLSGQIGAGVQMGSQNGASASNGANGMNQPSWADVSRPQMPASQNSNWQGGISAGMTGQSGGGSSLGMNQGFSGQGIYTASMQAGMSNSQTAHQNTGSSSIGAGMGANGHGQSQAAPSRPSSNVQINANGQFTTSKGTGISANGHATIGATSSSGANSVNQASWTGVPRPSSPASQNSDWHGGISAGMVGQSVVNSNFNSHSGQTGGGSSPGISQNLNGQGRPTGSMQAGINIAGQVSHQTTGTISSGLGTNGQDNWTAQRPSQAVSSQAQVLPAKPSSGNLQINANGQLTTSKNTGISVDAHATIGVTASPQPSQPHDNQSELNQSGHTEPSGQTQHQDHSADDWWGLGQIDDYPQSGPVYVGVA